MASAVFDQLSWQILAGEVEAGAALPAERALTDRLGVNRQAVREALQRMDQLGLVEIRHGEVTRVRDFRRSGSIDLLPRLVLRPDGTLDVSVVRSAMEMRAAIGTDAAARCAERATAVVLAGLWDAVDVLAEACAEGKAAVVVAAADAEFWDWVVDGADNIAYRLSLNSLRLSYRPVAPVVEGILSAELGDVDGHRAIAEAVDAGDPAAARAAATRLLAKGTAAMTAATIDGADQGRA